MNPEKILLDFFATHNIAYKLYKHQPLFTCADQPILIGSDEKVMPGINTKNLFLKDKKNKTLYLVSVTQDKRVDLKALSKQLECAGFGFGTPEELLEVLKLTPGTVNPFSLIFDQHNKVTYVLDEDVLKAPSVNFHPLRNDMNVNLTPQAFLTCMEKLGHTPRVIKIPTISQDRS